jgi:hypothetical protein
MTCKLMSINRIALKPNHRCEEMQDLSTFSKYICLSLYNSDSEGFGFV